MRIAAILAAGAMALPMAHAQQEPIRQLEPVVVSASRSEQRRFDAPAAIDAVRVDAFRAASPLVNLSELLSAVPGLQIRERQNYAQDLQISIRGFGTRSTFGVRGVRILIDGIPATMPDGQGQASTASLASAQRIEVLRGPMAQLYGNAAGGVLQVFTKDPPTAPFGAVSAGAGTYGQWQIGAAAGGGTDTLGAVLDVSHYSTGGYRDHSDAAPGYAVLNVRAGYEFPVGPAKIFVFGRIDNLLDKTYAGSLIVNDSNRRFFEPAAGRRLFVGLRSMF